MTTIKLTDKVEDDIMSIGELWEAAEDFCHCRVVDNEMYKGVYPIETRQHQMTSLKSIIKAIEDFHEKFNKLA